MAEQPRRRESSPRLRPGASPPQQPGWRVTPAPDGRGGQPAKRPRGPNPRWLALLFIVVLLGLNYWVSSQFLGPNPRVEVPYYPTFLTEVQNNNVSSISSTGNHPGHIQEAGEVSAAERECADPRLYLAP